MLKCLKETYLKQVKVIYIDPPYNTGKDFVYQDNYTESVSEYITKSGEYDDQGNINIEHEYMLCYAKSKYAQKNWTRQSEAAGRIIEQYKQLKKQGGSNEEIQKESCQNGLANMYNCCHK